MAIGQDIVDGALRKLGVSSPSNVERNNALKALNSMIASWGGRRLIVYAVTRENFTLTIGTGSYTIGSSGTFNTVRPTKIESAYLRDGTQDFHLDVVTSLGDFNRIFDKTIKTLPESLFYLQEYPLGKILFDYLPDKAYVLYIDSWKVLTSLAALSTTVSFPPEYERALTFNLAVEIASEYDQNLAQEIVAIAVESLSIIEAVNHQPMQEVDFDRAITGRGRYNIQSDTFK